MGDARPNRTSSTKRAILDAAGELAAENGITQTTMEQVAQRASVAKGSLYYNFSSKDELFAAFIDDVIGEMRTVLVEASEGCTGQAAIHALVHAMVGRLREKPARAKVTASEIFRTDRPWAGRLDVFRTEIIAQFAKALREDDAELSANDAQLRASMLFGGVLVAVLEWQAYQPSRSLESVERVIRGTWCDRSC